MEFVEDMSDMHFDIICLLTTCSATAVDLLVKFL